MHVQNKNEYELERENEIEIWDEKKEEYNNTIREGVKGKEKEKAKDKD